MCYYIEFLEHSREVDVYREDVKQDNMKLFVQLNLAKKNIINIYL